MLPPGGPGSRLQEKPPRSVGAGLTEGYSRWAGGPPLRPALSSPLSPSQSGRGLSAAAQSAQWLPGNAWSQPVGVRCAALRREALWADRAQPRCPASDHGLATHCQPQAEEVLQGQLHSSDLRGTGPIDCRPWSSVGRWKGEESGKTSSNRGREEWREGAAE